MNKNILLVLGSPNAADGTLGPIALSRLQVCQQLYSEQPQKIGLTGGFGPHFNTSPRPHAFYLKEALLEAGIPSSAIIALIESSHSVEDATLSKWLIDEYKPDRITIITSDFHVERARIIFDAVYAPFSKFTFVAASSDSIEPSLIMPLIQHEKVAIQDLRDHGVRF